MRSTPFLVVIVSIIAIMFSTQPAFAGHNVSAVKVTKAPVLDGSDGDAAWKSAQTVSVKDQRTGSLVTIKAAYTSDSVYFLVRYPDSTKNDLHKPWIWNKDLEVYEIGPQREDTFYFKWNMAGKALDLSNFADNDYTADVWYWKAHRTNPNGYADDKSHVLSGEPGKKATQITSRTGKTRYLMRLGDTGKAAQAKQVLVDYQGDVVPQYVSQVPEGSRADVQAKGVWSKGFWTIEFARKLDTGNSDDVQFSTSPGSKFLFGVSIKSCYGEPLDDSMPNYYGQGRISEPLYLVFK